MSAFYAVSLPKCDVCRKPATMELRGPYNARYGHACERHYKKRLAELEKAHEETKEFPTS
jgi:hypothetical protein